ncbi:MAG: hypothetical protein UV98_C0021G0003 [Parcubacteria group bacterium GW2011_GWB1_43_6]|nr:MAG: hypothetical protein UV98_C0021G0003 [Parcubacteria group bacterium GW2011_GWB1_43_6]
MPDLPGFGENQIIQRPWTINDYVEWAHGILQKNNLSRIILAGHSFGGSIAAKFSSKYPAMVEKLILIDSAGIRKRRLKKEIQKAIAHLLSRFCFLPFYGFFRKVAYRTLFRTSDYLLTEGVMKETYLKVIGEDISDIFSKVSVPTMLVWGKNDGITPLRHAYFINKSISGSKLEIISGVGHNPHREAPETLVEKIVDFIKS